VGFSTRDELKAAIADWLNRSDLSARIDDFIALTDAEIHTRLRRAVSRINVTLDSDAVALPPATCEEVRAGAIQSTDVWKNRPLYGATPEVIYQRRAQYREAGVPRYVAVVNDTLLLDRTPDQDYTAELIVFAPHTALTSAQTSNAVLQEAPNIYLYGALKHAAPFLEHDERISLWERLYDDALERLNKKREREEYTMSLTPARLPVSF
jgi:hypothetical protein